ncbi:CDP-alcohol phosphatidyltransferase family protein [Fundidesulfovibrio agrisoli]|uniref:CDP-alcohol phosphatidyltransferase family protein n=1 Tax=Fundidesulfovibrio agrisoli TaxID=2922717 RepID=UPI001FACAC1A|nr:CDP-alcohol phosphatidyltransferase family protein [Fundidesulfovibrio agrisoli]
MARSAGNWTIPNALTMARILLTPFFVVLFLDGNYFGALSMFFLAGLSDALDGLLARLLDQRSALGAILDPLADKILLVTSFICLAHAGWIPLWLAVLVVSRDVIILGGIAVLTFWGRDMRQSIQPSLISKLTTATQMALVLMGFLAGMQVWGGAGEALLEGLIWIAAALTVVSGGHYVAKGLAMFTGGQDQ